MRKVSEKYKECINDDVRNPCFMEIDIGVINREAQRSAEINSNVSYISDVDIFGNNKADIPYATYEQDFFKLDGSMLFPPIQGNQHYYWQGYVSDGISDNDMSANDVGSVIINFPEEILPLRIMGMMINFGDTFPTEFDIVTNGNTITYENNSNFWQTNDIFSINPRSYISLGQTLSFTLKGDAHNLIMIIPKKMNKPNTRMRIEKITFGVGVFFDTETILNATLTSYVHPISNNLSYKDFYFEIQNYDGRFEPENENSLINFFEISQDVKVRMGMQLRDKSIEWIEMESLKMAEWSSETRKAVFTAKDSLSFDDGKFIQGMYYDENISLYDLAVSVLTSMGFTADDYYIDEYLKKITTKNPIPICRNVEALQIIANASHSVIKQNTDGKIYIVSNFIPDVEYSSEHCISQSNSERLQNLKLDAEKEYFATYEENQFRLDGFQYFARQNGTNTSINSGFVSTCVSNDLNTFDTPPKLTLNLESRYKTFGLYIRFGISYCTKFIVNTYLNDSLQETLLFENNDYKWNVNREFLEFDKIEISFLETQNPNQRAYIDAVILGERSDYSIDSHEIYSTMPKTNMDTVIRNVIVKCTVYSKIGVEETIFEEDRIYEEGEEIETIEFSDAIYDIRCEGAVILDSGAYFVTIQKPSTKERIQTHLVIYGKKFNITESSYVKNLSPRGQDVTFTNPLIDSIEKASSLADWLVDEYLKFNRTYTFDWRGDIALEVNDIVKIANNYNDDLKVRVLTNTLQYNQGAIRASLEGRKVES